MIRMSLRRGSISLMSSSVMCCNISCSLSWIFLQLSNSSSRVMSVLTVKNGVFFSTKPPTPDTILYNNYTHVQVTYRLEPESHNGSLGFHCSEDLSFAHTPTTSEDDDTRISWCVL